MTRQLRENEKALLVALIKGKPQEEKLLGSLNNLVVEEMNDGGMGSLRFYKPDAEKHKRLGGLLAEKEFVDIDGTPVMAAVNLDDHGELFELDIWKVDFSPVKQFPDINS